MCKARLVLVVLLICLIFEGICFGQDAVTATAAAAVPGEAWRLAPENSIFIAGYDGREENPSIQVIRKNENKELRQEQQIALRKAMESFATLFGISLDFAKDIDSWAGDQWVLSVIPPTDKKTPGIPIMLVPSKNAAAADEALAKLLAPWERIGEIKISTNADCTVRGFVAKKQNVELYASACGPVVILSPSEAGLRSAVAAHGPAEGSPAAKTLQKLNGSVFYLYASPSIASVFSDKKMEIPVDAFGMGLSVLEIGYQLRMMGLPKEQLTPLLDQVLGPLAKEPVTAAGAIPGTALAVTSVADLSPLLGLAGMIGMQGDPKLSMLGLLTDLKLSAGLTSVLPLPGGVIVATAAAEQAAADKAGKIRAALKTAKIQSTPIPDIDGLKVESVAVQKEMNILWTQVGSYLLFATDRVALTSAANAIKGERASITANSTYNETITGLGGPNIMSLYVSLEPVRGIGYLMQGLGINRFTPVHQSITDFLENLRAFGVGVGYDGQMVNGTMFLRTKPGAPTAIAPVATLGTAVGAAVLFPVFARARQAARMSECKSNLSELAVAAQMYASDHNGKLPSRQNWRSELKTYINKPIDEMVCVHADSKETIIAYNKNLGGLNYNKIANASEVVMFFEANKSLPGATGSRNDVAVTSDGTNYAFADGHVECMTEVPGQSHWVAKYAAAKKPVVKAKPGRRK